MRHHYWEWMLAVYLFLGGLGGGIFCLSAILSLFVFPDAAMVQAALTWPAFIGILCLGFGCVLLVLDLGQPLIFYRAFLKSTSVLAWGARLLFITMVFGFIWFLSFIPWEWFKPVADFLVPFRELCIAIAGITGTLVMLYTGIFLSTLKAHAVWATPALPVLFTVSALSTGCALICISAGFWPAELDATLPAGVAVIEATHEVKHLLHTIDIILIVCELVVLLVMILSFLGAGNKTANKAAHRWVHGSYALAFWGGMIFCGLVLPEFLYLATPGLGSEVIAPVLVLCGGCLLRFLIIYSDDRAPLPGENEYYNKIAKRDDAFVTRWTYGENLY